MRRDCTEEAEMVKLLENTFRAVNIGLVNEMVIMCDRLGTDIWRVIEAVGTKPFGFIKFLPGPGLGGHCTHSVRCTLPIGRAGSIFITDSSILRLT